MYRFLNADRFYVDNSVSAYASIRAVVCMCDCVGYIIKYVYLFYGILNIIGEHWNIDYYCYCIKERVRFIIAIEVLVEAV